MLSKLRTRLSFANVAAAIALCLAIGGGSAVALSSTRAVSPVASGTTIRGAIGGDYHAFDAQGSDFGAIASLPQPAANALADSDVFVNVANWKQGDGQTPPTTTDTDPGCTGRPAFPTAPAGKVCIYVSGADHAFNLRGNSVLAGTRASTLGFKLNWDASTQGDTFVDATWAYKAP